LPFLTLKAHEFYRLPEYTKLEYIKVKFYDCTIVLSPMCYQEIGFTHMRVLEGVGTIIQLAGLVARLCKLVSLSVIPSSPALQQTYHQNMDKKLFEI
jgi:hypothetical protein